MIRTISRVASVALFFSCSVFAGNERGNGGDVVVCPGTNSSVRLLDYFEGKMLRGLDISLGDEDLPVLSKVQIALSRLAKLSPQRAEIYLAHANEFLDEAAFLSNVDLEDVNDSGHIILPRGCEVKQIAVQRIPEFPSENRYVVSKELWDQLDNTHKAGLVLHEVIYRELIEQDIYPHINSRATRHLNAYLASEKFEDLDFPEFLDELLGMKFLWAETGGVRIQLLKRSALGELLFSNLTRFDDGYVKRAPVVSGSVVESKYGQLVVNGFAGFYPRRGEPVKFLGFDSTESFELTVQGKKVRAFGKVEFYPNGDIRKASVQNLYPSEFIPQLEKTSVVLGPLHADFYPGERLKGGDPLTGEVVIQGRFIRGRSIEFQADLNARLTHLRFFGSWVPAVFIQGKKVTLYGEIQLYPNGNIRCGVVSGFQSLELKTAHGGENVQVSGEFYLDEKGLWVSDRCPEI